MVTECFTLTSNHDYGSQPRYNCHRIQQTECQLLEAGKKRTNPTRQYLSQHKTHVTSKIVPATSDMTNDKLFSHVSSNQGLHMTWMYQYCRKYNIFCRNKQVIQSIHWATSAWNYSWLTVQKCIVKSHFLNVTLFVKHGSLCYIQSSMLS